MNPRDFLDVAQGLGAGAAEAEWRAALSLAYRAAVHVARRLLLQCGFEVPRTEQASAYLWRRLANSGHAEVIQAGQDGNHLWKMRNRADYDLDRPLAQATAQGFVRLAESMVELLETVEVNLALRAQVTDAMKLYERDVLGEVTWHP